MAVIVDSNILLDILAADPVWRGWSLARLGAASTLGPVFINDVVYAEISVWFAAVPDCDAFIEATHLRHEPIPRESLFLAAGAHRAYRRRGGTRTGVLSDFFIGAHAAVEGWSVLTRDTARYRTYFPYVALLAP